MILEELKTGKKVRCVCESCEGTGIYKGVAEHDDLGVICHYCNGTGNYVLNVEDNMQLVRDNNNGVVYVVIDGIISHQVELFKELNRRTDVNYVMYGTGRFFSPTYLFEHGASEINVIRYEEFLNGVLPLPIKEYVCPRQLSQDYGDCSFDNDCFSHCSGSFAKCDKYGKLECWNKFYDGAQTIDEKQAVMRMINKKY